MKIIKKYASYGRNLLKEKEEIKISSYQCFDIQCEGSGTDPPCAHGGYLNSRRFPICFTN